MAKFDFTQRYKDATSISSTDGLILDVVNNDVPNRVAYSDFFSSVIGNVTYTEKTSNYTLTSSDVLINCTANNFTITLPTASGIQGKKYTITNSGSGVITIDANASETISGDLTQIIYTDETFDIISNGTNWIVI